MVVFTGHIHRGTMGQMAALCQIHAHDRIAGLEQGKINAQVCLCTRMRLHIGVLGTEQLASTVARDVFHNVNILAAAVVALAWVALCILIGEHATHCGKHRRGNHVLGSDHFQVALLALEFILHGRADFGVRLRHKSNCVHHIFVHFVPLSLVGIGRQPSRSGARLPPVSCYPLYPFCR